MIKIDLNSTYEILHVSESLDEFSFETVLKNKDQRILYVRITEHPDPLLPEVYNLGFGPLGDDGEIDDKIILKHENLNLVFSTILLCAITFLNSEPVTSSIGIDGSNDVRAYLYHRMFLSNKDELSEMISIAGVDWYVRLLRDKTDFERDVHGSPLIKPRPEPFDVLRPANDMYRYYMFSLYAENIVS